MNSLEKEGVVLRDGLSFLETTDSHGNLIEVNIRGTIECASGVRLYIDKTLEVQGKAVRAIDYSYHAYLNGGSAQELLRYDTAHGGLSNLHRHTFDPTTGLATGKNPIAHSDLPTLVQVIREACDFLRAACP